MPASGTSSPEIFEETAIPALTAAQAFIDPREYRAGSGTADTGVSARCLLKALVSQIKLTTRHSTWKWAHSKASSLICRRRIWRMRSEGMLADS